MRRPSSSRANSRSAAPTTRGRKATSARELRLVRAKPYTEQVFLGGARRVVGEQSVGYRQRNGGSTLVIYPRDEPLVLL